MQTISSPLLSSQTLLASFTTRYGGVSKYPYASANLAFHVGDFHDNVITNHTLLSKTLRYKREDLVHMRQIHSDLIIEADFTHRFETPPECDALITDKTELPLMVMSADCTPILLYDPIHRAVGAVHAGRAGALKQILPKTIQKMKDTYGTDPRELLITMGPSIHGCCYEINETIAQEVEKQGYAVSLQHNNGHIFLDVNTILLTQLHHLSIPQKQIEIHSDCTACHHETYFSYRADTQHTGRIAGVIMLR